MKKIFIKPEIHEVPMLSETIIAASSGDPSVGGGETGEQNSRSHNVSSSTAGTSSGLSLDVMDF